MALARQHGRFLMEAMWTACHPVVLAVRDGLAGGRFGTPRHLRAEFGTKFEGPPDSRIFDAALGAGAMLDVGIYPLTVAHLMLGPAEELRAVGELSDAGLRPRRQHRRPLPRRHARHPDRVDDVVVVAHGLDRHRPRPGRPRRTPSTIPAYAEFIPVDGDPVRIEGAEQVIGRGYGNEIAEVGRCLREGLLESPLVPHEQTLLIMRQIDDVLRQVGARR